MNKRLKRITCLHTFIERVIHSIRVSCLGLLMFRFWCLFFCAFVKLVPIDFHWVESTSVGTSRDESSTFCTLRHPWVLLPVSTISASAFYFVWQINKIKIKIKKHEKIILFSFGFQKYVNWTLTDPSFKFWLLKRHRFILTGPPLLTLKFWESWVEEKMTSKTH